MHENPRLLVLETCAFSKPVLWWDYCIIDGKRRRMLRGKWAVFIPSIGAKILLAEGGNCYCEAVIAPSKQDLLLGKWMPRDQKYSLADWQNVYGKSAAKRAAECFVAARRLYNAGLGPKVTGLVAVKQFKRKSTSPACASAGFLVDDLRGYRRKKETTEEEMLACGVQPDKSKSCLRQQIRGYVSDLNSVVGVIPLNAEAEIAGYETELNRAVGR